MNTITLASSIAMAVGLAAALPQILRMVASRSSAGQSQIGWGMGLVANACMGYVNFAGFHAEWLATSNAVSAALCLTSIALIARFRAPDGTPAATGPVAAPAEQSALADLPTTEFVALKDIVDEAHELRLRRGRGAAQPALEAA